MSMSGPSVAIFRPDDERLKTAITVLTSLGADPVPDPMLSVKTTGEVPREDSTFVVFTSKTGAELIEDAGWKAGEATVCAIGATTATALQNAEISVDVVPETYTSAGLVEVLSDQVDGTRVEVARSDHGSDMLLSGLQSHGAYVHETILYELERPPGAGISITRAVAGSLDAVLFTSSLTVEHFVAIATERGKRTEVLEHLDRGLVGAIGEPTAETAREHGIDVDVIPESADFAELAKVALKQLSV